MKISIRLIAVTLCALTAIAFTSARTLTQDDAGSPAKIDSATVARRLSSQNPYGRRAAAEELARLAAAEHRRLVEGYFVQEKDSRVRLAMAWALYRMGKSESLFALVRALDEKKLAEQSVAYLKQLEGPDPLYVFLDHVNGNTQIRLLEVLASVGDRATLERVKPFTESLDPLIADAAKFAEREINIRLQEQPNVEPKRPRKVGSTDESQPPLSN
jgi:HEAT repeat protein